ncbi:MAG: hypothetical protein FJY92_10650, partial [Candidatus Hydrogenedentes bacterium]|nr:hypothetical protein [Candidatus Hydrogenedentota bacterium]
MPYRWKDLSTRRQLCAAVLLCAACFAARSAEQPAKPAPGPNDAPREALKQQIESYNQKIDQAEALATDEQAARIGVSIQDLHDYALRLRETRGIFEDHLDAIDATEEVRRSLEAIAAEIGSFAGLPEPPPYAPWVVDTYRDAFDARTKQREIARRTLD